MFNMETIPGHVGLVSDEKIIQIFPDNQRQKVEEMDKDSDVLSTN